MLCCIGLHQLKIWPRAKRAGINQPAKFRTVHMGAGRHGQGGGGTSPCKCYKVFCALAVIVKRTVDQLFMHYFHNFSSARHFGAGEIWRVGVIHLVVLACALRATEKGRQLFSCTPPENILATPMNLPHPWKKNPAGAHDCTCSQCGTVCSA